MMNIHFAIMEIFQHSDEVKRYPGLKFMIKFCMPVPVKSALPTTFEYAQTYTRLNITLAICLTVYSKVTLHNIYNTKRLNENLCSRNCLIAVNSSHTRTGPRARTHNTQTDTPTTHTNARTHTKRKHARTHILVLQTWHVQSKHFT